MSFARTVESRPYDAYFDPVFTTPQNYVQSDPRVVVAASNPNAVSGSGRYRFFRRPIMPRISAIPPQILLAPTTTDNPLIAIEEESEPLTKTVEIQTMYRESEAQTIPYTPEYVLEEGTDPEILMLKNLTYQSGLPVGYKELEMIEQARMKRDLENNMLPFTDEACFHVRKIMMEQQELKEYKLREAEVENQRNQRLELLERTLVERDENIEFLSSQRIEAIRQSRMEIREKTLQKIRKKRINILRKLARKRNMVDPVLSTSTSRDIINDYFDRGSDVYAPNRRDGQTKSSDKRNYDITGRTAPLSILNNVESLDATIPRHYTVLKSKAPPSHLGNDNPGASLMSKTTPALIGIMSGGRAAMPRLTSAATRNLRNTKKDVETMHQILTKKKALRTGDQSLYSPGVIEERNLKSDSALMNEVGSEGRDQIPPQSAISTPGPVTTKNLLLSRKPKGRPRTPDYTSNKLLEAENLPLYSSVVLLQKLIRGRAVQNSMFEGRYRRRELINELRSVDDYNESLLHCSQEPLQGEESDMIRKLERVKNTTVDSISGSVTSGLLVLMVQEKDREEYFKHIQVTLDPLSVTQLRLMPITPLSFERREN